VQSYSNSGPEFAVVRPGVASMPTTVLAQFREVFQHWVLKKSLLSLILLSFAAHAIYYVLKIYRQYRVSENLVACHWRYLTRMVHSQMSLSALAMVVNLPHNCQIDGR
jgi:hypothetical protein